MGTLTGDASPLYIVDGFQVDNIDYLANSDIESIEVLKDASSAAIYGSRAANGVVMVTTKSGKVGRPVINYSGSASYRKITKMLDVLSPYEFVKLQGEIDATLLTSYYKTGNDENGNPYRYQSLDDYIGVGGVNWQEETFNPTWSQDHNLSIAVVAITPNTPLLSQDIPKTVFSKTAVLTKQPENSVLTKSCLRTSHSMQPSITYKRLVRV